MHPVSREIVIPPLFIVRNNRRACGFKSLNRVSSRCFIETIELGILAVALCDSLEKTNGPWDTANRLGGYGNCRGASHTDRCLDPTGIFMALLQIGAPRREGGCGVNVPIRW
jgi:hypothetical protein